MAHIAIVGAGTTGVTTAYALLDCGYRVTLFERQRYAAMETSLANGGQLSASSMIETSTVTINMKNTAARQIKINSFTLRDRK